MFLGLSLANMQLFEGFFLRIVKGFICFINYPRLFFLPATQLGSSYFQQHPTKERSIEHPTKERSIEDECVSEHIFLIEYRYAFNYFSRPNP